ncbi:MAG TPA: peptide deformylase [Clostridia bacterium]|nr:peptide deformylase [Clostridia bacterium]
MAVYRILELGDPTLREKSKAVTKFNTSLAKLLTNLADTMYDADGVGLAAPQIGVLKRVVVVDVGDGLLELVNPEIVEQEGEEIAVEGCLSIPGRQGNVKRASRVKVRYQDRYGNEQWVEGEGLLARALQHEIDHLDGILYIDKLVEN